MYLLELVGEDDAFARAEAASACSDVRSLAPALATARGCADRVASLAYTRRVCDLVGTTDASVESARALLDAAGIDREGTVAVRASALRGCEVDTRRAERELGSVLVARGFAVDLDAPDHELRAYFAGDTCALGWLAVETPRDFSARRPTDRPFFQPGSMDPMFARALVNLAGARPGTRLLDPMCGTGGVLVEAGLVGADVLGLDAQAKMTRGARENLAHYLGADRARTLQGDATHLPLRDDSVDAVVFDAPYGRQSKVVGGLDELVGEALAEARRVAPRCVLVADRSWCEAAETAGWAVEARFSRRVHRSLDRHVLVLSRDAP
ncbi:methyltransferase domain-containing protein [Halomarina ordinaria]|uniref:tRNA (guanine(10)-N(2))-dimethyltransferase n=1 Tax=Halomarina ordinaria TaxID=3033939 RepID=A0ABD5U9B5_9EURY|nr:methyltransferase domain-containing protein [Halomarina sp. PSRA2]